jgi:HEPN domain-containing protein
MESSVEYWREIAEYDIGTAEAMLSTKRYLYVGFMCHQAVEKILKAYFVFKHRTTPPYIHKLVFLAEKSSLLSHLSEEQIRFLETLQPFNIEARYPSYKKRLLEILSPQKCESLIRQTKEFVQWINNQLSTRSGSTPIL